MLVFPKPKPGTDSRDTLCRLVTGIYGVPILRFAFVYLCLFLLSAFYTLLNKYRDS